MTHKINQVTKHKIWNIIENYVDYSINTITTEDMENYKKNGGADINIDEVTGVIKVMCLCNRRFGLHPTSYNKHISITNIKTNETHILGSSCTNYFRDKEYTAERPEMPESVKEAMIDYKKGTHRNTFLKEISNLNKIICKNPDINDDSPLNAIKVEHYRLCRINQKYIALKMLHQDIIYDKNSYIILKNKIGRYRIKESNRKYYIGKTFEEVKDDIDWNLLVNQYKNCESWATWNQEIKKFINYKEICSKPPSTNKKTELMETIDNIKKNFININDIENLKSNYLI
mgnify:CR=1 FL=1